MRKPLHCTGQRY